VNHYITVAHEVSSADYEEAVRGLISYLTPEQRAELGSTVQAGAQLRGTIDVPQSPPQQAGHTDLGWF
jgi:hypothetical protein